MPTTYWARTDSNSANNPALNLTGANSVEITFIPFGTNGDILLDANGGTFDPDTQVVIGGTAYSFVFEFSANLPTLNRDGAQQVPSQFEGSAIIVITVQDYPTAGDSTRLTFLPDDTATQAEMDSFGNGAISLQNIVTDGPGVICFATGTLILTPKGERPVETLQSGDLVVTIDHGPQPIVWASASKRFWPGCSEKEKPVLLKESSLGRSAPTRDLVVSPQHKILLTPGMFGSESKGEALAPAKGLISLPGVRPMQGKRLVIYHHLLFKKHEIILSNGIPSESFYPGPTAMKMLTRHQRKELLALFPRLVENPTEGYGPQARRALTVRETREIVQMAKGGRPTAISPSKRMAVS